MSRRTVHKGHSSRNCLPRREHSARTGHGNYLRSPLANRVPRVRRRPSFTKSLPQRTLRWHAFDGFVHERSCYSERPQSGAASLAALRAILGLEVAGFAVGLLEEVGQTLQGGAVLGTDPDEFQPGGIAPVLARAAQNAAQDHDRRGLVLDVQLEREVAVDGDRAVGDQAEPPEAQIAGSAPDAGTRALQVAEADFDRVDETPVPPCFGKGDRRALAGARDARR